MKGWVKVLTVTVLLLIIVAVCLSWCIDPKQRFSRKSAPILVSPTINNKTSGEDDFPQDIMITKDSFNILLLGIDARGQEESRTDAIMLANVNPKTCIINLIPIPRDTRVQLEGVGYTKINHAHFLGELKGGNHSGTRASMQAVSNLFQCNINYYLKINFTGFERFVDNIGGIEIKLSQPVKLTFSDIIIPADKQLINGDVALQLVRERFSLMDGDFGRQKHQVLVLKAIIYKLLEPQNIKRIPTLVCQFYRDVIDTNLSENDMLSLGLMFKETSIKNINYIEIPGEDGYAIDPLINKRLYYWIPDLEKIEQISKQYLSCDNPR